jgi:hypothetical protein
MSRWRGRQVGVVFQFFQLLPTLTAAENLHIAMDLVGVVPKSQRAARALALLDRVGVADQAGKLPAALSGGQQQRVAIARALANDPPLLLADEPTGNLDTETASAITGLFSSLSREGKTLVLVTHDDTLGAGLAACDPPAGWSDRGGRPGQQPRMSSRWRKAWADLRSHRVAFALIALVLILGTAGMVAALDAQTVLRREIAASFDHAEAADMVLWFDGIDEPLRAGLAAQPGVAAVAVRRVAYLRIAGAGGREFPLHLSIVADPLAQTVARAHAHGPVGTGLWVEQSGQTLLAARPGEKLDLRDSAGAVGVSAAGRLAA